VSYNVDSIDIIKADNFRVSRPALMKAQKACGEFIPECSPFDLLDGEGDVFQFVPGVRGARILDWQGEGSGWAFDALMEHALPAFVGSADLVVCFDGGDSYKGIRVKDGKVTEHEVVRSLGKEVKRRT
jgi:hypothetical protein